MAKPRIFISSTYYDLKHIRASLDTFVLSLGYEPVLSEKGEIAYNPDIPLDESCYRDAANADIFVLIIGGRYGSIASADDSKIIEIPTQFHTRYESVTKKEFLSATENDVPSYILIDRQVYSEYGTYKRNRESESTNYAHVDSVNIFKFLDEITARRRNNPMYHFDKFSDIELWLRDQWAGLFRELLSDRSNQKGLSSLSSQVEQLSEVNATIRRYLEEVMSNVGVKDAAMLIESEHQRLEISEIDTKLRSMPFFTWLEDFTGIDFETAKSLIGVASSMNDLAKKIRNSASIAPGSGDVNFIIDSIITAKDRKSVIYKDLSKIRSILGKDPFLN